MGTPNERSAVDEGAASPEPLGKVVPLRVAAQPPPPLEQLVEQTFSIAIGLTALASEVLAEAVARTLGREPFAEGEGPGDETSRPASGVPLVAGAALGVALEAAALGRPSRHHDVSQRRAVLLARDQPRVRPGTAPRGRGRGSGSSMRSGASSGPGTREAAAAFLRLLIPQAVDAALDQIDLNELVAERIELDQIIDRLDLDRAIAALGHRRRS